MCRSGTLLEGPTTLFLSSGPADTQDTRGCALVTSGLRAWLPLLGLALNVAFASPMPEGIHSLRGGHGYRLGVGHSQPPHLEAEGRAFRRARAPHPHQAEPHFFREGLPRRNEWAMGVSTGAAPLPRPGPSTCVPLSGILQPVGVNRCHPHSQCSSCPPLLLLLPSSSP